MAIAKAQISLCIRVAQPVLLLSVNTFCSIQMLDAYLDSDGPDQSAHLQMSILIWSIVVHACNKGSMRVDGNGYSLILPRLGKRELILVLFVRLFDLCLFRFVGFLFLLGSGKGCG